MGVVVHEYTHIEDFGHDEKESRSHRNSLVNEQGILIDEWEKKEKLLRKALVDDFGLSEDDSLVKSLDEHGVLPEDQLKNKVNSFDIPESERKNILDNMKSLNHLKGSINDMNARINIAEKARFSWQQFGGYYDDNPSESPVSSVAAKRDKYLWKNGKEDYRYASPYAAKNQWEDRAETRAMYVLDYNKLAERADKDKTGTLWNKIRAIEKLYGLKPPQKKKG